jgi:hypothetical protein
MSRLGAAVGLLVKKMDGVDKFLGMDVPVVPRLLSNYCLMVLELF